MASALAMVIHFLSPIPNFFARKSILHWWCHGHLYHYHSMEVSCPWFVLSFVPFYEYLLATLSPLFYPKSVVIWRHDIGWKIHMFRFGFGGSGCVGLGGWTISTGSDLVRVLNALDLVSIWGIGAKRPHYIGGAIRFIGGSGGIKWVWWFCGSVAVVQLRVTDWRGHRFCYQVRVRVQGLPSNPLSSSSSSPPKPSLSEVNGFSLTWIMSSTFHNFVHKISSNADMCDIS